MKPGMVMGLVLIVAALAACTAQQQPPGGSGAAADAPAPAASAASSEAAPTPAVEGLGGTAWRLLDIASMDDSVVLPDDPSKYTLALGADGAASLRADCNRGTGTWKSEGSAQIQFGPIAATRALCPPGSISEQFLAQFEWVRSYVMRDGHLFLATMADGAIIEFEPLPPVVGTVLGEELRANDADEARDAILTRLFDRYAAEKGIAVEAAELDAFVEQMRSGMAAEGLAAGDDLSPDEQKDADAMQRKLGEALIRQWKINKSLFASYGGRIAYQQLGPEPLDAYRRFLEERQAAGEFKIENPAMAEAFWRYYTDDSRHDFMAPGGTDAAQAFATPPWKQAPQPASPPSS